MKNKISSKEFAHRRSDLMNLIGNDAIAIIPSAQVKSRNNDAEFAFRQDSDFLYLTGFNEPDAVLVLVPERDKSEVILFCREKDPLTEQWTGRMAGIEGAVKAHGADDAFPITDIDDILPSMMEDRSQVYYSIGNNPDFDKQVISWVNSLRAKVRNGIKAPQEFISLNKRLHNLRLFKSPQEQQLMRDSATVAVAAHEIAMKSCKADMMEYALEAEYLYAFKKAGMEPAYTTIVGGGENACILHYIDNNQVLNDNELVLIDAGAENQGYASDITRTFPINGKFTEEQRQLYQITLDANYAAIELVKPGNRWNDPHDAAVRIIATGLLELGLIEGGLDALEEVIKEEKYKPFYMHKTGHWLGLDVHDVGDYKVDNEWRILEAGMTLTVEPGVYVSPSDTVDKKWWNIGIRIEDDVLVTETGNEVLTGALVKNVDDIEGFMINNKEL